MTTLHTGLANTVSLFMLIMGVWALFYYIRNQALDGSFFGIVAVGEILIFVQATFGLLLLLSGEIIFADWLAENTTVSQMKYIIKIFDIRSFQIDVI